MPQGFKELDATVTLATQMHADEGPYCIDQLVYS